MFWGKNKRNREKNVHRFALIRCNKRGTFEIEREREMKRKERERDSFWILYTGYLLSIVKIKREKEGEGKRDKKSVT